MSARVFVILITMFVCAAGLSAQQVTQKKNSRPQEPEVTGKTEVRTAGKPVYFYKFEKPEFVVGYVHIEHDEEGLGKIVFRKKDFDEEFTRPVELSPLTIENLKTHWNNLDFLNSDKSYQAEREYPHLGKMTLRMVGEAKERTAEFNWTENPDALFLSEEYKKIGYEYVWMFNIEVAIKNQPLMTPQIMNELDSYLRRDRISDPPHLLLYLRKLGDDERMPMISRNHAKRLVEYIEKKAEKN